MALHEFFNGMGDADKNLIESIMDSFITEVPEKPFITFCVVCKKGVTHDEMKYVSGRVFHPECFEQHGNEFTVINPDLISKNASAKIEIVQLKNLKIRQTGGLRPSNPIAKSNRKKPKRKTKKKRKAKRRPPRRRTSRRLTAAKRRTATRKSRRKVKRSSKTRRKVRRSSSRKRRTSTRRKKARRRR